MEAFYEESSIASNAKRGARRYKVWAIFTMIFLILGILTAFFTVWMIPTKGGITGDLCQPGLQVMGQLRAAPEGEPDIIETF